MTNSARYVIIYTERGKGRKTMTIAQSIQYAVSVALGDKASANVVKGA